MAEVDEKLKEIFDRIENSKFIAFIAGIISKYPKLSAMGFIGWSIILFIL
jgi:hypothetical protein